MINNNRYKIKQIVSILSISAILFNGSLRAQQALPKGAGGTGFDQELWLTADDLLATSPEDESPVLSWQDVSPNQYNFVKYTTYNTPIFSYQGFNFHPAVSFINSVEDGAPTTADRRAKLVSSVPFELSATKAYYIFWVSSVNTDLLSGNATLLAFNTGTTINDIGWSTTGAIRHTTRGTNSVHTSSNFEYGIGSVIIPNVATTTVTQQQYINAIPRQTTIPGRAMVIASYRPVQAIMGNSTLATNAGSYFGNIQEIIVLSAPAGSSPSSIDLAKVHSYLALKYGIALQEGDYVNSDGETIWSNSKNEGYLNNIFGIGRDEMSGLHQKQSVNSENSMLALFVGSELADLNSDNTSTYFDDKDKAYLLLGDNGLDDFFEYLYKPGEGNFLEGQILTEVNNRSNKVFRAQISGQTSFTVNMRVGGRYVLVSANDPTFAPENTRLYPIKDGIAKDVKLKDGDYISVATFETAPGAVVNGLKLWLKADNFSNLVLGSSNDVLEWKDQTSNGNNFTLANVAYNRKVAPQYIECDRRTNFYPSLLFDANAYLAVKTGPMTVNAPTDFTSFVVYHATAYSSTVRLYTHGFGSSDPLAAQNRRPAMGFAPQAGVGRVVNSGGGRGQNYVDGTVRGFRQNSTALQMINTHKAGTVSGSGYAIHDFGGWQEKVPATGLFGNDFMMATGSTIGGASLASGTFQGLISEIFFYERALTEEEQDKIRTYLGIKYAITLDADGGNDLLNYDYKLSDGTIIWAGNSLPNRDYHRNVAGLTRDDASELYNNKAKSSADGATIMMAVEGHDECSQGSSSMLANDNSGLYWGHNGVTTEVSLTNNPDVCGSMDFRLGRIWLVDKTNLSEQTVRLSLESSDVFPYGTSSYQVYFLVASSAEDLNNNKWDVAIPAQFVNGSHQLEYTFREKYTYFTLGIRSLAGACEACEFDGVKKVEFTNATWPRGATERLFDLGDGFTANVKTTIGTGASFYRNYPRASSLNSLYEYRSGLSDPFMTTEITVSKSALANFQIFQINQEGNRYDDIEVWGLCGTARVMPKLSYVLSSQRSSYTIISNTAKAKMTPRSSYTGNEGKMQVEFEYPVEKIFIRQKATGAVRGAQSIGVGPIEFMCPVPLPPVNEEGLVMTSEAPKSVLLCENVPYTFRVYNANCSSKPVNFQDVLPEGMVWVKNSLSVDEIAIGETTQINDYGQTRELNIESLIIPGGQMLTFRALATFEETTNPGVFASQAVITYPRIVNNEEQVVELFSCDRWLDECLPTSTEALYTPNRPKPIKLLEVPTNKTCYREGRETTITLKLDNPNGTIEGVTLELNFNEEFTYIPGSLQSETIEGLDEVSDAGELLSVENINLPTGIHTITMKLRAPVKDKLVQEVDENNNPIYDTQGNPMIIPLEVTYSVTVEATDMCYGSAFDNLSDAFWIPYCTSKSHIISNRKATQKIKR